MTFREEILWFVYEKRQDGKEDEYYGFNHDFDKVLKIFNEKVTAWQKDMDENGAQDITYYQLCWRPDDE